MVVFEFNFPMPLWLFLRKQKYTSFGVLIGWAAGRKQNTFWPSLKIPNKHCTKKGKHADIPGNETVGVVASLPILQRSIWTCSCWKKMRSQIHLWILKKRKIRLFHHTLYIVGSSGLKFRWKREVTQNGHNCAFQFAGPSFLPGHTLSRERRQNSDESEILECQEKEKDCSGICF